MNKTTIEWTDYTWNPVTGCHKVSPGCKNCYAETLTKRFGKQWGMKSFRDVQCHYDRLREPIDMAAKLKGKRVFVCDMSDLFQESVPFEFIDCVMATIHRLPDTQFQILTKRPERMLEYFQKGSWRPMENCIYGTSVENQNEANNRIPILLKVAGKHFVSCEPLLGPVELLHPGIDWVIVGGESGHGARPMHPDWARSLRDECAHYSIPFFFKQWGEFAPAKWFSTIDPVYGKYDVMVSEIRLDKDGKHHAANSVEPSIVPMSRYGKSKSGHLLDGEVHHEFPEALQTTHA